MSEIALCVLRRSHSPAGTTLQAAPDAAPSLFCQHDHTPELCTSPFCILSEQGEPLQHTDVHERSGEAAAPAAPEASAEPEMATAPSAHSTTGVQVGRCRELCGGACMACFACCACCTWFEWPISAGLAISAVMVGTSFSLSPSSLPCCASPTQAPPPSHLTSAASTGGLREPPPSPTASSSPAGGGPGDVALLSGGPQAKAAGEGTATSAGAARELPFSRLQTGSTMGEAAPEIEVRLWVQGGCSWGSR